MANRELGGQPDREEWVRQIRKEMEEKRLEMEEELDEYYSMPSERQPRGRARILKPMASIDPDPKYL
ncbi:hypothetical protein HYT33_00695 [Candidatus Roizmanbacteria bacterium]|nr:hypothetical protein [Candidatus Roizmanbacteria bacterium]